MVIPGSGPSSASGSAVLKARIGLETNVCRAVLNLRHDGAAMAQNVAGLSSGRRPPVAPIRSVDDPRNMRRLKNSRGATCVFTSADNFAGSFRIAPSMILQEWKYVSGDGIRFDTVPGGGKLLKWPEDIRCGIYAVNEK
ncbi:hypothetical protein CSOJ01_07960 [Colletotrichum sojae]|uniref:Uncharacterized protein n=1 Tax=Colletotrichum sojae TaxID=2175907 RepID=A0A8H6J7V4_9PEZI|nr:hypothetical protein CSOJ01_07960 [Colletotrichum sojae]